MSSLVLLQLKELHSTFLGLFNEHIEVNRVNVDEIDLEYSKRKRKTKILTETNAVVLFITIF